MFVRKCKVLLRNAYTILWSKRTRIISNIIEHWLSASTLSSTLFETEHTHFSAKRDLFYSAGFTFTFVHLQYWRVLCSVVCCCEFKRNAYICTLPWILFGVHDGPGAQPSQTFVEKEWKGCPDWIDKGQGDRLHTMLGVMSLAEFSMTAMPLQGLPGKWPELGRQTLISVKSKKQTVSTSDRPKQMFLQLTVNFKEWMLCICVYVCMHVCFVVYVVCTCVTHTR